MNTVTGQAPEPRRVMRVLVGTFALLLIYDGALRKWFFPGFEQLVFLVKDALLLAVMTLAFTEGRRQSAARLMPVARLMFAAYVIWVALEAFNPRLPNLVVGIWGVRSHVLYAALIVLLPLAYSGVDSVLDALERAYAWIVIPVVALALVQLAAPAYSVINQAVRGGDESVVLFGTEGLVRVSGTFSYVSGMAAFVQIFALGGIALYIRGARSRSFLVGLAFALLAVPVTGSRGVVVVLVAGVAILLIAAALCRFISGSYAVFAGVVLLLLAGASMHYQGAAWRALQERAEAAHGDESRALTAFTSAFRYFEVGGALGFGAGAANFGSPSLVKDQVPFSWLPPDVGFEEESGRIVLELGIIGWLISIAMRAAFLIWAGMLALRGAKRSIRVAAVFALPIVSLGLYQGNGVFAPPIASAFYWFCIALLAMAQHENDAFTRIRGMEIARVRSTLIKPH